MANVSSPTPSVKTVVKPIAADMLALDEVIRTSLHSKVSLINSISDYIIGAGGKRLRPALVLLMARALDANDAQMQKAYQLAAIVEFIHTATLLHDDVVDESTMRRGRLTANAQYGNSAAVLVGDFLYSRSFQMMTSLQMMEVMNILADTTNTIAEGEVLQLLNCKDPDVDEKRYMNVIDFKTAKLFEAAGKLGGLCTSQADSTIEMLGVYGSHLGIAFQLIDDVLDYEGDSETLGKNVGDDLREGKPTLPLIYALHHADQSTRELIAHAISEGGTNEVGPILHAIQLCGALEYTREKAYQHAQIAEAALATLPSSTFKEALCELTRVAVQRSS